MTGLPQGAIELRNVSRSYRLMIEKNLTLKETLLRRGRVRAKTVPALADVSLDIAPGTALGVVGANGAGKSTLLKLIAGILPPDRGTVRSAGRVVSLLELGAGFHPDFSGRENVILNASIHGVSRAEIESRMERIVAFAELEDFIDAPVRTYSSGMYARLGFAVASEMEPEILLLDEILAVGDAAFQNKCVSRIAEFQRAGVTIVFVSHAAGAVELVCNRAIWISGGRIRADGDVRSVLEDYHQTLATSGHEGHVAVEADNWRLARITGVTCLADGRVTDRFVAGDPFTVGVDYEVADPTSVIVALTIRSLDGVTMGGSDSRADLSAPTLSEGRYAAAFSVESLPLLEGRFTIDVGLHTVNGDLLQHVERVVEFTVFPNGRGIGPIALGGIWANRAEVSRSHRSGTGVTRRSG